LLHINQNNLTMSDPATSAPTATPRKRSPQNRAIAAYIADSDRILSSAKSDPEIQPLLEARGYDTAEFALGEGLITAAETAYADRAGGVGTRSEATETLRASIGTARNDYAAFRIIGRANFPDRPEREALGLTGEMPDDTGRFITIARASYHAGKNADFTAKLTKRGYAPAILDALLAGLDTLTGTDAEQDEATGDAIGDTAARDAAYESLKTYMKEFKGTAKGALRGRPDLLAKLGL
jgi:hypothetical protein